MRFLALVLLVYPLLAQSEPWIDMSWPSVNLPHNFLTNGASPRDGRYFWLRKSFELPASVDGSLLALTLGKLAEHYDLFVNGVPIWSSGPHTKENTYIPRPRTFDLPPLQPGRVTVAIRAWSHSFNGAIVWRRHEDVGPYVLTGRASAPRWAEKAVLGDVHLEFTPYLFIGAMLFTISIILLLIWLNDRSRLELVWLASSCLPLGIARMRESVLAHGESTPWDYGWLPPVTIYFVAAWAPLLEFLMAVVPFGGPRFRLVFRVAVWGTAFLAASRDFLPLEYATNAPITGGLRPVQLLLEAIALFQVQYHFNGTPLVLALFGFAMVMVLIRRLLDDRAEKQRLTGELEAAREIQQLLLPSSGNTTGPWHVDVAYEPAQEVGGDFYWTRTAEDGSLLVVTGDVSGKGLKAAMLVSVAIGALRSTRSGSPADVLGTLNRALFEDDRVTIANAGHPSPYCNGREISTDAALPLGLDADDVFAECQRQARQYVTFVSDGALEAANSKGELFGFERTQTISGKPARELLNAAKAWGQNDDITVVAVQRRRS